MKSDFKRLSAALFLSVLSFSLTFVWYYVVSKPKNKAENQSPSIAFIQKINHEVHRKSAARSLWEPIDEGEPLHMGDAVRTSNQADVRIQFSNSDKYLELEPDSLIVLQQNDKEISLDLMEGSAFVNASQTQSATNNLNLTLNTQGGKIDLSKTTALISGSSQSKMDIKVIKGTAQFKKQGAKVENIEAGNTGGIGITGLRVNLDKVKILAPDTTKPFLISAENPTPLQIKWEGFPPDAQVLLESGKSRKSLFPTPSEKISKNELNVKFNDGTYYWKLKAIDPDSQSLLAESAIYKTEVVARYAPVPIAPEANFIIFTRKNLENITLRWGTNPDYSEVLVELLNESNGNQILSKKFPNTQDSTELQNLPLSNYKWKLTAYTTSGLVLAGNFHRFSIQEKRIIKIPIVWNPTVPNIQYYVNSEPKLTLQWSAEDTDQRIRKWKIRYTTDDKDLGKTLPIDSRISKYEKILQQKGRYLAVIDAIDEDGDTIGTSEVRSFTIEELPLLKTPQFTQDSGDFLAKGDGTLTINWQTLEGAKNYNLLIRDPNGKIVLENSTEANLFKFTNLMPGDYDIQISGTDNYGRRGEISAKRKLLVPSKSEVKAPKLKKIKIN